MIELILGLSAMALAATIFCAAPRLFLVMLLSPIIGWLGMVAYLIVKAPS